MKIIIIGIISATIVAVLLNLLNIYILKVQIPEFTMGYLSAGALFISMKIYEDLNPKNKKH